MVTTHEGEKVSDTQVNERQGLSQAAQFCERLLDFAACIVNLTDSLTKTMAGRHIAGQLLRSGTSSAACYEEACAAESRADFIHKLQLSLKELRESRFWLRLIDRSKSLRSAENESVLKEADQLCNIVARSVITAKKPRSTR
ncbi:MAG: four helix bundle protein [Armatimonadota bacterium]